MDVNIYQFTHPWHWLTYGNNSTALAALIAIAGLVGLFLYVRYTKAIMNATLASLEASIFPVLTAQLADVSQHFVHWKISNLGRGHARNVSVWRIEEGNGVEELFGTKQILPEGERAIVLGTLKPDHYKSESLEIKYPFALREEAFLVIIETDDNAGNKHQLQVLSYGKESSKGYLYTECFNIPPERKPNGRRNNNRHTFIQGKGTTIGVDLNSQEIDGSPFNLHER